MPQAALRSVAVAAILAAFVAIIAAACGGSAIDNLNAISAGGDHTCGWRDDGAIRCWGWNKYGQTDAPAS